MIGRKAGLFASAASFILLPTVSVAQTTQSEASVTAQSSDGKATTSVNEIIVTAQKRDQSINDVGMSITALSGDTLIERGVRDTEDLVNVVPGLTFTPSPYAGTPIYTLRGVGFYEFSLPASPAVTVYVDEVALPYQAMTTGATLDLERVEVLKGPQGTLFGQNATGGAINYVAAKPTDYLTYGGDISFGRFSTLDASAFVSGPLSENMQGRIAVRTVQSDDWQQSYTRDDTLGEAHRTMGRLLLDWQPVEKLELSLNLNGWKDGSDTQAGQVILVQPTSPAGAFPELLNQPIAPRNARAADWTPDWPMKVDDWFAQASVRATYEVSPDVDFTSISSYQHLKISRFSDVDGTPAEVLDLHNPGEIDAFNQELRFSGQTGALTWIVGANYATADLVDDLTFHISELSVNTPIPGLPLIPISAARTSQEHETYAIFGNGEYALNDSLTLNVGARYTRDRRDFRGCSPDVSGFSGPVFEILQGILNPSLPVVPIAQGDCFTFNEQFRPELTIDTLVEDNLSWRLGLDYTTLSDILFYANVSRGYKAGAFPTLSTTSTAQYEPITQEQLTAYEVGFKAPLAGRAVQLNAAAFYYDYKDKQLRGRLVDPIFGLLEALVNVPKSRIWGLEFDLQSNPMEGLQLSLSGTYIDSKVIDYTGLNALGQPNQDFSGERFPYSPELTLVADISYDWSLSPSLDAFAGSGISYHSRADAVIDPTAGGQLPRELYTIDPYTLLDLRAGVKAKDDSWRVQVFGRNVLNEYYWTNTFQSLDTVYRLAGRPVTYGVLLSFRR